MLQTGKMEEIANELKKYNIQITALQDVRWPQDGWIKKNYTLLHSGPKTSKGQYGTGFITAGCAAQFILGFEPINERTGKLRIRGKCYNMTIINACAATEDENKRNNEYVERFYNKL